MRIKVLPLMVVAVCAMTGAMLWAGEPAAQPPKAIAEAFPRLATGALTFARLAKLPEGVVLRAGDIELHVARIDGIIAAQPPEVQEDLRKNAHLILNQLATREILLHFARARTPQDVPESEAIQKYLEEKVLNRVEVTDAEVKAMYESEKAMFGGATLDQMQPHIKRYLLEQKKQDAVTEHIRTLGKRVEVEVAESWLSRQAPLAQDNPVERVRDSGRPSLVDFGATGCTACDMMTPILDELKAKHPDRLNILFVHVRERPVLAARYGIQTIPVQVFFDKDGNEVFRHVGFFPRTEIEKKLAQMGVTP